MANTGSAAGQTNTQPAPEISGSGRWVIGAGLVLAVVGAIVVAAISPDPNVTPESAAGVLALVTAGAVAIERILEAFWTLVGLKNDWWPMSAIKKSVDDFTAGVNKQLANDFANVEGFVKELQKAGKVTADRMTEIKADIERLRTTTVDNLETLARNAPANQRLQFAAASADRALNFLESKYPELQRATFVTGRSLDIAADFVATFKDNPGRRLISISFGAILGLIAAWALGLDAFQAAYQAPPGAVIGGASPQWQWGVALTGLLMGLGATPTHEVIKLVQEVKKSRKTSNREL
jgi:hypothetical protein